VAGGESLEGLPGLAATTIFLLRKERARITMRLIGRKLNVFAFPVDGVRTLTGQWMGALLPKLACPSAFPEKCSSGKTLFAFAALRLYVFLYILSAVVDSDFLSGLNRFPGPYPDTFTHHEGFRVRLAGVVDVARQVAAGAAINSPVLINLKQIFAALFISLFAADDWTSVLDDTSSLRDTLPCI
jgi:hypothetical protein